MNLKSVSINDIYPDESQPRKYFDEEALERLTVSIRDNGIEQPIAVKRNGKGYTIIDGERRWRASKSAGLKDIPCMVVDKDNPDDILEMQLRSDCLKEDLTVDELDRAIYRYYEHGFTTSGKTGRPTKGNNAMQDVARKIGKSFERVRKAIDRFEFKRENKDFVKEIEQKHHPKEKERYGKINSTIAMTDKLSKKPEVRKAVIKTILENRENNKLSLDNEKIRDKVKTISDAEIDNPEDAITIMNQTDHFDPNKDPRFVFNDYYSKFRTLKADFEKMKFEDVQDQLGDRQVHKFIEEVESFLIQLKNLGGK